VSVLSSLFETRTHPSNPADWFMKMFGGTETAAGVEVTNQNSLEVSAVYACVRVLAETVGMLPLILYERAGRGKQRATEHPLYQVLRYLPNPEMTAIEFREMLMGHLASWGNAFAEIQYGGGGQVLALWPLRPDKTRVARINGRLRYVIKMPTGSDVELPAERIMHLRGLSYDGVVGYDPIMLHRQTVGLAKATEEFGARFFGNGAALGVVYQHPGTLGDTAYDRLKNSLERRHQGLTNAHRIAILEEGMEAKSVGIPPENAQFLETRKFSVIEIARFYRMPPHKIQSMDAATFGNIEEQSIEFVTDTIQPWLTRFEQGIWRDLLTRPERTQYFAEHLIDALLRGNTESRYQAYSVGRNGGWLSANDIRERENMNPVEGGDVYLVPLNMVPADMVGQMDPPSSDADGERSQRALEFFERRAQTVAAGRQRLARSFERVILDVSERILRREINDVRRAVTKFFGKRDATQFSDWLQQFYEEHRAFWKRQILPVLLNYADQVGVAVADEVGGEAKSSEDIQAFIDSYVEALAARQVGSSHLQLQALLDEALLEGQEPEEALEARLDSWEEKRPGQIAREEAFNANNAFTKAFYILAGITRLRWVATGESCPYCRDLDGKVVGVQENFLDKDTDLQPDGAARPINVRRNISHPPIHDGCDCVIVAER